MQEVTLRKVKSMLKKLQIPTGDEEVVMLSAAFVGNETTRLAEFTKVPMDTVMKVAERCRSNGIWSGDKITANWLDPKEGQMELILDCMVAKGLLSKTTDPTASAQA